MQWYAVNMRLLILNGIKFYYMTVHVRVRELLWHIEGVSLLLHIFFYKLYIIIVHA